MHTARHPPQPLVVRLPRTYRSVKIEILEYLEKNQHGKVALECKNGTMELHANHERAPELRKAKERTARLYKSFLRKHFAGPGMVYAEGY